MRSQMTAVMSTTFERASEKVQFCRNLHPFRAVPVASLLLTSLMMIGCKNLVGDPALGAGAADPNIYDTADGALLQAEGVRVKFRESLNQFTLSTGLLTDELTYFYRPYEGMIAENTLDARQLPEGVSGTSSAGYELLQNVRVQAALAATALATYVPDSARFVRGEMFAIEGYAEVMLADLFCSGVPLSLPRKAADIDYRPGSSRDAVYAHALTMFDSALALAVDSAEIATLAKVGRGRAWLARGQYDSAAHAVASVATHDAYQIQLDFGVGVRNGRVSDTDLYFILLADGEGENGRMYRSGGDPRTRSRSIDTAFDAKIGIPAPLTTYYPTKYVQTVGDSVTFIVASGVEARLIEGETALHGGNVSTWLAILNALRTTGRVIEPVYDVDTNYVCDDNGCGTVYDSTYLRTDTTWAAGSGGISGLPPLTDPGTPAARIDTMFGERAAWLYLSGHRQEDLRRLVRAARLGGYGRQQRDVYPVGRYADGSAYDSYVNVPIPTSERLNPNFHGCLDRDP